MVWEPAGSVLSTLTLTCDFWPRWVSGSLSVKLSEIFLPCAEATLAPPALSGFYSPLCRSP